MTSKERALEFLRAHLGQTVSMQMLGELSEAFENHRDDERQGPEGGASGDLRVVADLDEEVDDDSVE